MRWLSLSLACLFAATAHAQTAPAAEVPCTVPAPLPPVPPPPPAPSWNQGACCDEVAPPAPVLIPYALPRGASLVRDEHGQLFAEVTKRTPRAGVFVPGLMVWFGTYLGTTIGGMLIDNNAFAAIPLFGGMASAIGYGLFGSDGASGRVFGYAMSSMLQVGGLVTFIVGMAAGKKLERTPISLTSGGLSYRF